MNIREIRTFSIVDTATDKELIRLEAVDVDQAEKRFSIVSHFVKLYSMPVGALGAVEVEAPESSPCTVPSFKNGWFSVVEQFDNPHLIQ